MNAHCWVKVVRAGPWSVAIAKSHTHSRRYFVRRVDVPGRVLDHARSLSQAIRLAIRSLHCRMKLADVYYPIEA